MRFAPVVVLALAATARADDNAARAAKLFEEGRALAKAGQLAEACAKFDQSFTLDAETGTEVNLADCLEKTGNLRRAWMLFDAAAASSLEAGNTTRAKFARDRADALDPKLAKIVLHVEVVPKMKIQVSSHEVVPDTQVIDRVEPGDVLISAFAPDHQDAHWTVKAPVGARVDVAVALAPVDQPRVVEPPPPEPPQPVAPPPLVTHERLSEMRRDPDRVRLAKILGLGAGVTTIASVGLAAYAKHEWSNDVAKNDISGANGEVRVADDATFVFAAGVGLGVAATIVYFTAPQDWVVVAPTGNGVAVAGHF